jgi:hypothetical protein
MSVDFTGKWNVKPQSDPFLPGIEAGMIALRVEHIDPLLQVTMVASAPGYALGNFVLNYRTDHTEVITSTHGMQVRTNAFWDSGDELVVDMSIRMGSYQRHSQSSWSLSDAGKTLTIRHMDGNLADRITIFHQQDVPEE